jgi:NhaA family Na+:H+ antiporter
VLRPFYEFAQVEAAGGIILIAATVIALLLANSPWADVYFRLWQTIVGVGWGDFALTKPLLLWVNDGLMAVFFLVVGLEIKREIRGGELADARRAALPIAAAIGGMAAPAAFYLALNAGSESVRGWGVPMATDIAFALGLLALVGRRAPIALKVFLASLAIVDDIGAVVIIAVFYTADLAWMPLAVGALILAGLAAANRMGVRHLAVYVTLGLALWFAFLQSGVHATVAGVLLAMTIPSHAAFLGLHGHDGRAPNGGEPGDHALRRLVTALPLPRSPMIDLEHVLHPYVTYGILPLFALANAGVAVSEGGLAMSLSHPVGLGILCGLILGKQIGITLAAWLAVRSGLATLPTGVAWRHIYGAAWLGGIGFTMSIFISGLAFEGTPLLEISKVAVFVASATCGVVGWAILRGGRIRERAPLMR